MKKKISQDSWRIIELVIKRHCIQEVRLKQEYEKAMTKSPGNGKTNYDTEFSKPQSIEESFVLKIDNPRYKRLYNEVKAFDRVYNSLPDTSKQILKLRYWDFKHPSWKALSYTSIDVGYSERQMKRIVRKIIYDIGIHLGEIEKEEE